MERDPDEPAKLPIKVCFTNIYIGNQYQVADFPSGAPQVDCRQEGTDADWDGSRTHETALTKYVGLVNRMARYQLHMAERIYVYCAAGEVRSVTTAGIYLMRCGGLPLEVVWRYLVESLGPRWRDHPRKGVRVRRWLEEYVRKYG